MHGCEGHAAMAGHEVGGGKACRTVIDWVSVRAHDPQGPPASDNLRPSEQREGPDRPVGDHAEHAAVAPIIEADLLLGVADHDAALVGLANRAERVVEKGSHLLGHHDLPALGSHRCFQSDHRGKARVVEASGEDDRARADLAAARLY